MLLASALRRPSYRAAPHVCGRLSARSRPLGWPGSFALLAKTASARDDAFGVVARGTKNKGVPTAFACSRNLRCKFLRACVYIVLVCTCTMSSALRCCAAAAAAPWVGALTTCNTCNEFPRRRRRVGERYDAASLTRCGRRRRGRALLARVRRLPLHECGAGQSGRLPVCGLPAKLGERDGGPELFHRQGQGQPARGVSGRRRPLLRRW